MDNINERISDALIKGGVDYFHRYRFKENGLPYYITDKLKNMMSANGNQYRLCVNIMEQLRNNKLNHEHQ